MDGLAGLCALLVLLVHRMVWLRGSGGGCAVCGWWDGRCRGRGTAHAEDGGGQKSLCEIYMATWHVVEPALCAPTKRTFNALGMPFFLFLPPSRRLHKSKYMV